MFTVEEHQAVAGLSYSLATVNAMLASSLTKRGDFHIRISLRDRSGVDGFTTIAEEFRGNRSEWEFPYDEVTYDKTRKTVKNGFTSRELHQMYPQFLDEEDGEFWGTAMRGNLIVSCSGVEPEFDEAIANMIIGIIFAIVQVDEKKRLEREGSSK